MRTVEIDIAAAVAEWVSYRAYHAVMVGKKDAILESVLQEVTWTDRKWLVNMTSELDSIIMRHGVRSSIADIAMCLLLHRVNGFSDSACAEAVYKLTGMRHVKHYAINDDTFVDPYSVRNYCFLVADGAKIKRIWSDGVVEVLPRDWHPDSEYHELMVCPRIAPEGGAA